MPVTTRKIPVSTEAVAVSPRNVSASSALKSGWVERSAVPRAAPIFAMPV